MDSNSPEIFEKMKEEGKNMFLDNVDKVKPFIECIIDEKIGK